MGLKCLYLIEKLIKVTSFVKKHKNILCCFNEFQEVSY